MYPSFQLDLSRWYNECVNFCKKKKKKKKKKMPIGKLLVPDSTDPGYWFVLRICMQIPSSWFQLLIPSFRDRVTRQFLVPYSIELFMLTCNQYRELGTGN